MDSGLHPRLWRISSRASFRLSCPASAITVWILGNRGAKPATHRAPPRRSDVAAGSTRLAIGRPSVSTRMWSYGLSTFMGIEAACTAALGSLHRLSIHNHYAGTSRSPGCDSHLLVDSAVQFYPHPFSFPSPEIMVDGTPSGELMRQQPAIDSRCAGDKRWR